VFVNPLHPYSERLINAFPSVRGPKKRVSAIGGFPPDLLKPPQGCRFNPRCPYALEICVKEKPALNKIENRHLAACHLLQR
jgi:peptide/nickel transport system ATP-binding protein